MEKKYDKNRYYAHDFKGNAVMAKDFETLQKFYDYAGEKGMQVVHTPLNAASTMVSNYTIIQPTINQ